MIVVVMPSRGRPAHARRAIAAIRDTAVRVDTSIILAVDENDPTLPAYRAMRWPGHAAEVATVVLSPGETGDLVKATNTVSLRVAEENPDTIIANFGDDHHARTMGWDRIVSEALVEPGVAYGDDLFQGEALPTAPFISARIVLGLGWYALPGCKHLFIDNAWRDVGVLTGTLRYLPEVVIEHRHPLARKGQWDEGYERANRQETIEHDGEAYQRWRDTGMAADIERVRQTLAVAA